MGFFGREPTIGNSNLTQSDLDRLLDLDDTYRTDYTYVTSKSYRPDGSDDYENPRMSRLPISYYRRKWAFEKARKSGFFYYTYFCVRDFLGELISNPATMILGIITETLRLIIRVFWFIVDTVFPNPEGFAIDSRLRSQQTQAPYLKQRRMGNERDFEHSDKSRLLRKHREFRPSPTPGRVATWRAEPAPSPSVIRDVGRLIASVVTLGLYPSDYEQRQQGAKRRLDSDESDSDGSYSRYYDPGRYVRRHIRTSSYEYSEDREPEFGYGPSRPVKPSEGGIQSLIYKLFFLGFMAILSPIKTLEFTTEKIAWIFGFRNPHYDLRSRVVYKNRPVGQVSVGYSDRFANWLAELSASCVVNIFSLATKALFLPISMFSYIAGRMLGLDTSRQPLQRAAETSAHYDYISGGAFRCIVNLFWEMVTGFLSFLSFLQNVPFHVAEQVRERVAHALANTFGPRAALLVGFEEMRPVTRRVVTSELDSSADGTPRYRQQLVQKVTHKSRLYPTRRSVKCCSTFWKWIFPLLVLLFLINMFSRGRDGEDGLIVSTAKLPLKILTNLFNVAEWTKAVARGLNYVFSGLLYLISIPLRLTYNLFYYPGKLFGSMIHPREAVEKMIELPKYVYMTGHSMAEKTLGSGSNFLFGIPNMLYDLGESVVLHFLEGLRVLGSGVRNSIRQIYSVPEWILSSKVYEDFRETGKHIRGSVSGIPGFFHHIAGRILDNIFGIISSMWGLARDLGQLVLTLPSYFISRIIGLVPFGHRTTEEVKWSVGDQYDREQAEFNLERLRHEKELLESKMAQLRRERELEENRYKDIHEAIRLVAETPLSRVPPATNEQLLKSVMVNEELLQHKIEEDFQKYVANLKKTGDAELTKRLLAIENRLVKRLDALSKNIEDEVAQKITHTSQESGMGQSALSNELSELSSAVANLRAEFDKLRREKETRIAEFAHAIMSRDSKQGDDLNLMKIELNNKIKDDLERGLSSSLSRFEKASHEEREAFRLEIMKMVENRVVALFASHLAEKTDITSDVKAIPALSESDFMIIKRMINDALDTYDADKTGKVDYALESSGASVVSTRCTEPYKENSRLESVFGIPLWYSSYSPRAVIQHRPLAAGECWAFRGKGYLTIKLSHPIFVTEVSYEHLHSNLHPEGVLRSAPRLFHVYSYKAVDDLKSKFLLGEFEYDINGRALQTFRVQNKPSTPVSIIELVVQSNWDSAYTCLYRFRVHGQKA